MSKATYWQRGENIDYQNTGAETIDAGTVLAFGSRIGVAATVIGTGATGSIAVTGVFEIPKGATEIKAGATVYFDTENDYVTATKGTLAVIAGYAIKEAAAGDDTVLVKLLG